MVIKPTDIEISIPTGSNDSSNPFTDDVFLERLVFDDVDFATSASFEAISRFRVLTGPENINAEWGDNDDAGDGDDNPFAKAGFAGANQETEDPAIQNATLLNAFNSNSLSEMSDGERGDFSFQVEFSKAVFDNDTADDDTPEVVLFERGGNDRFTLELMVDGTFENPGFSSPLTVDSSEWWNTGIAVNTLEIDDAQDVFAGGFDLNDFGLSNGEAAFGMRITAKNAGPDLNGFFLSSEDPDDFVEARPAVTIEKTVNTPSINGAGQVTYTYVVENDGNTPLTDVVVTDDAFTPGDTSDDFSPIRTEAGNGDEVLDVGETWVFEASETVSQSQIDAGDALTNVATVTTAETDPVTAEETVTVAQAPGIALDKTADRDVVTATGQTVTYTYTVENTGNVSLNDVTIVDDAGTPGNPADDVTLGDNGPDSGDTDGDGALDPDEEWIFTWEADLGNTEGAAELTNTAVVTTQEGAEDSDTATVSIEPEAERCTDVADHFDRPDGPVGATLVYAPAAPYRNGTDADDFAWGDDRGNTISTNGGENVVVANGGNDIVNGGNAADEIYGDAGNDILNGNGGDDRLSGGAGNDKLYGAHGDDKIMAGDGDDLVEGGAGDDRIHGGAGNDTIQGEGGDDCIAGGADDGRIDGSIAQGLTVTIGDRLFGNGGADLFEYEAGDGVDFMFDFKAEDGDTLKLFGLDEDDATAVTANTPYGPAAGLAFDTDGDGRFDGGVFFQQIRHTAEVDDLVQDNTIEFV